MNRTVRYSHRNKYTNFPATAKKNKNRMLLILHMHRFDGIDVENDVKYRK